MSGGKRPSGDAVRALQRDGFRREIVDSLVAQGWRVEFTPGGHVRCVPPDRTKSIVVTAATPGDHRGARRWISDLRHSGFIWRGREARP